MGKKFKKFCKGALIAVGGILLGAAAYAYKDELLTFSGKCAKKATDLIGKKKGEESAKEPVKGPEEKRETGMNRLRRYRDSHRGGNRDFRGQVTNNHNQ